MKKPKFEDYSWLRNELLCEHGIGHGSHVHGCDGCCGKKAFIKTFNQFRKKSLKSYCKLKGYVFDRNKYADGCYHEF
jgi:hypothetical protein